jgi:hypothetical protein
VKRLLALAALSLAACLSPSPDTAGQPTGPGPSQQAPGPKVPPPGPTPLPTQPQIPDPVPPNPPAQNPGQPPEEGGGSDTETLTGFVNGADGSPLPGVPVKLLPAAYDPSHPDPTLIRRVLTDATGKFSFAQVDTALSWNVIAGDSASKAWALAQGLRPGPMPTPLTLSLGKVFLVNLHSSGYGRGDSGIAYFPGTDILTHCNGITSSLVDSVPSGANRIIVESRAGWTHDTTLAILADTVRVLADRIRINIMP